MSVRGGAAHPRSAGPARWLIAAVAHRRLWALQWQGVVEAADADPPARRVAAVVLRLMLGGDVL